MSGKAANLTLRGGHNLKTNPKTLWERPATLPDPDDPRTKAVLTHYRIIGPEVVLFQLDHCGNRGGRGGEREKERGTCGGNDLMCCNYFGRDDKRK